VRQTKGASRRVKALLAAASVAALVGLLGPRPAEANLIGDPTLTNGAGRFGVGGELDFVLDRDLENGGSFSMETTRVIGNASFGLTRNIDGFVKLGLFNGELGDGGNIDIDPGFAIGVGGRASFIERGDLRFGVLAQVLYFNAELDTGGNPDIDWIEFDIAPAVSFRGLGQIVPYAGLKLSWLDGDTDPVGDFENDDLIGIFGGASFAVSPTISVGAELRLLDESAIGAFVNFKF
jgi:hypothetical protein